MKRGGLAVWLALALSACSLNQVPSTHIELSDAGRVAVDAVLLADADPPESGQTLTQALEKCRATVRDLGREDGKPKLAAHFSFENSREMSLGMECLAEELARDSVQWNREETAWSTRYRFSLSLPALFMSMFKEISIRMPGTVDTVTNESKLPFPNFRFERMANDGVKILPGAVDLRQMAAKCGVGLDADGMPERTGDPQKDRCISAAMNEREGVPKAFTLVVIATKSKLDATFWALVAGGVLLIALLGLLLVRRTRHPAP